MSALEDLICRLKNVVDLLVHLLLHLGLLFADQGDDFIIFDTLLACNRLELLGELFGFGLDQAVSVEDFSAPIFITVCATLIFNAGHRLNHIKENFGVVNRLVGADNVLHAGQDHELVFEGEGGPLLDHSVKSVAHDRDQHVQHCDLSEEGG